MTINQYSLFAEWRNRTIYGATLSDAITRATKLQRPDQFADGRKVADGDWIGIKQVVQHKDTSTSTRGNHAYQSVIIETDNGQYMDVDAIEEPVTAHRGNRTV